MDADLTKQKRPVVMLANAGHKPLDTRIFFKESKSLREAGWPVTLIIPYKEDFIKDGIQVKAVRPPAKGWEQLVRCPLDIWKLARRESRRSVFHLHDSELLIVGLLLKLGGRTVVYDAHEDTPLQISYQHWIPSWIKWAYSILYRLLEKLAGWFFDAVIVAEPVIARYFPSRKVLLVRNFPIMASFKGEKPLSERKDQLVYVGLLSRPRGAEEMLAAFKEARTRCSSVFVLGGKFAPAILESQLLPQEGVQYLSWLPYEKMIETLYESRIGVIVPNPIERYRTNYPVKLFEYMAAGMPVIASREGESAAFVREAEAGMLVNPLDPHEIAEAMVKLATDLSVSQEMGRRGRRLILEKYNWESEARKLVQLYSTLPD
ncbi:MAG: glycosyltransferase [Bacteroidetes bacterium]|nr:glycosyltransferase [Bacteroidota bacterium]